MKTFFFSKTDDIYKIFQVLDKIDFRKYKKVILDIDPKNDFFSNRWWLKLVLEKAKDRWITPIFVIVNNKQEQLMKEFSVNYLWKKEPLVSKIRSYFFDFLDLFKWNNLYRKYSKTFRLFIVVAEFSLIILLSIFVYNLVTPKTDVYIQPAVKIKHIILKIFLAKDKLDVDFQWKSHLFYKSWTFTATDTLKLPVKDISYIWKPSEWIVKFINTTNVWYSLRAYTQLITNNWLIFRLENWVYVPPATWPNKPWYAKVKVIAADKDIKWQIIGSRWNILEWTKLYIKKMYISVWKKKIYATADSDFKWWALNSKWVVTLEDVKELKKVLNDDFKKKVRSYIYQYVKNSGKDIMPLMFSWTFGFNNVFYNIYTKPWEKVPYVKWDMQANIWFYYIYKDKVKSIFKEYLISHVVSMDEFLGWNDSSLQILDLKQIYTWFYVSTFSFDALLWYDFNKDYNDIKTQILEQIPWLPIDQAKSIILSYPAIAWVDIKTTNSLNRVSKLKSRIFIHITK